MDFKETLDKYESNNWTDAQKLDLLLDFLNRNPIPTEEMFDDYLAKEPSTPRKFYKTIYQVEILSEDPIPEDMSLENALQEAFDGDYSARELDKIVQELNGKEAADALYAQGSEPSFFGIDVNGEPLADGFEAEDEDEWIVSHENTGESMEEGFLSEHEAYLWLKANLDTLDPPEMSEYVITKAEK